MFGDAAGCPGDAGNADCKLSGAQQPWGSGGGGWTLTAAFLRVPADSGGIS